MIASKQCPAHSMLRPSFIATDHSGFFLTCPLIFIFISIPCWMTDNDFSFWDRDVLSSLMQKETLFCLLPSVCPHVLPWLQCTSNCLILQPNCLHYTIRVNLPIQLNQQHTIGMQRIHHNPIKSHYSLHQLCSTPTILDQ